MDSNPAAVRNFRDFLQLYNKMTEMCFQRCVDNVNLRKLDSEEIKCVEDCSQKFVTYNNKLMQYFVRVQGELVHKRMKEVEDQQQQEITAPKLLETQELSVQSS